MQVICWSLAMSVLHQERGGNWFPPAAPLTGDIVCVCTWCLLFLLEPVSLIRFHFSTHDCEGITGFECTYFWAIIRGNWAHSDSQLLMYGWLISTPWHLVTDAERTLYLTRLVCEWHMCNARIHWKLILFFPLFTQKATAMPKSPWWHGMELNVQKETGQSHTVPSAEHNVATNEFSIQFQSNVQSWT